MATEPETFTLDCEYTDTFGGEANYCWVERATLTLPCSISDREMVRRVKAEFGLTGVHGTTHNHGDSIEFRPAKACTVVFANVRY
jgi:hypothetical protein